MHFNVHTHVILFTCIFFMQIFNSLSIPCDSCGNECANACGTKHFRTCCFNYLRKRSDPELFTNKRLIDVMMLQGRAMYTENELSNNRRHAYLQQPRMFDVGPRHNGTVIDVDLKTYYD
ncbi:trissin [Glossina fuscipes]|uniref:Trissin n=1 Tax=Glossina fuscipes TaxID=7396 RepID=A0A9C6DV08_9MUSC|nr:trissin [Glossina fuscipes]